MKGHEAWSRSEMGQFLHIAAHGWGPGIAMSRVREESCPVIAHAHGGGQC